MPDVPRRAQLRCAATRAVLPALVIWRRMPGLCGVAVRGIQSRAAAKLVGRMGRWGTDAPKPIRRSPTASSIVLKGARILRFPVSAHRSGRLVNQASFVTPLLLILALGTLGGCDGMSLKSFDPNKGFLDPSEVAVFPYRERPGL